MGAWHSAERLYMKAVVEGEEVAADLESVDISLCGEQMMIRETSNYPS